MRSTVSLLAAVEGRLVGLGRPHPFRASCCRATRNTRLEFVDRHDVSGGERENAQSGLVHLLCRHGPIPNVGIVERASRVGEEHNLVIVEHRVTCCGVATVFGGRS